MKVVEFINLYIIAGTLIFYWHYHQVLMRILDNIPAVPKLTKPFGKSNTEIIELPRGSKDEVIEIDVRGSSSQTPALPLLDSFPLQMFMNLPVMGNAIIIESHFIL